VSPTAPLEGDGLEEMDPSQESDNLVDGLSGESGGLADIGGVQLKGALLVGDGIEAEKDLAVAVAFLHGDNVRETEGWFFVVRGLDSDTKIPYTGF